MKHISRLPLTKCVTIILYGIQPYSIYIVYYVKDITESSSCTIHNT